MTIHRNRWSMTALLAISVLASGCAREGDISEVLQTETEAYSEDSSQKTETDSETKPEETQPEAQKEVSDNGYFFCGAVFQESGITLKDTNIYAASWEDPTARIICIDPTCIHRAYDELTNPDPKCSAAIPGNYSTMNVLNSFLYKGKRIILGTYMEYLDDDVFGYTTEVYECNLDGSNREKVAELDVAIYNFEGLILDGYLYCTVQKQVTQISKGNVIQNGQVVEVIENEVEAVLCSINLDTWEMTELQPKQQFGTDMPYWQGFFCMDDSIYCIGSGEYPYRIDTKTQTGESLPQINKNIYGAANGKLFYPEKGSSWNIMAYDVLTGEEELFMDYTDDQAAGFAILNDQIITCSFTGEDENITAHYNIYNYEKELLGSFTDTWGYTSPMFQIGENIVYRCANPEEAFFVKAEELCDLKTESQYISIEK